MSVKAYQNKNVLFCELLELGNAVITHPKNVQVLVTGIFKVKKKLIIWINEVSIWYLRAVL